VSVESLFGGAVVDHPAAGVFVNARAFFGGHVQDVKVLLAHEGGMAAQSLQVVAGELKQVP